MNILLLTPYYPPVLNSAARLFADLAADLAAAGHQPTVITTVPERYVGSGNQPGYSRWRYLRDVRQGIAVYTCPAIPLPKGVPLLRGLAHFLEGLQYLLAGFFLPRQDVVIAYSPPLPLAAAGVLLARRWKGRAIVSIQDLYPQSAVALGYLKNRVLIRLALRLERWVYRHASAVTVHSSGNAEYVMEHGGAAGRLYVVPNWIDLEQNRPRPPANGFRRELRCEDALVVSFAGNMGIAQGMDDIVEAASNLRGFPIVFLLAGEGSVRSKIERRVKELDLPNVLLLPYLTPDRYADLLLESDVCLVTLDKNLRTPAVPGKLPHIMAFGRPVVCSVPPTSDAGRLVQEAGCGLWVEAGQPKALAAGILRFLQDSSLGEAMGHRGRLYAEQHLGRTQCVAKYREIISGFAPTRPETGNAALG